MAKVKGTPFSLVVVNQSRILLRKWDLLRINVLVMVGLSVAAILAVIWWGSATLVNRIYEADLRRVAVLHEVEYTNKLASIGRLAAGVAHEINNPVAIINEKVGLMTDLLSLDKDFTHQEKFLRQAQVIKESVKRVSEITHRLLGFARHLPVKTEDIHLQPLIKEVLGFLGREAEYRNIDINLNIPRDIPPIQSDKGQLQQVLLNILNNALAAVKNGGEIHIAVAPDGMGHLVISVADNGVGIPKEHLNSIFEPFFSTKGERGTGLGLSITYGIVQKLGGRIEVESDPGLGTTFTVALPIKRGVQRLEDREGEAIQSGADIRGSRDGREL
jgi:signal transduction histidine kinase